MTFDEEAIDQIRDRLAEVYRNRPAESTGIYITSTSVRYGYRVAEYKMPNNFFTWEDLGLEPEEGK